MAITGIDTIDGKQIIAAGAVSAKSAEMAYNDENGNPITGYLTAVPAGTMNESAFGYDSDNKISSYNGSAFAGGSYQPSGNYIPYTAVDSTFNRFKTNSGLEITTSFGGTLNTNFINSNYISLRYINSNLNINNQSILSTGSLRFQTKSDSAYADREKIHKWDSASDYIQNNSATINEVNTSYQTNSGTYLTAHQDLSDYQTTAGMTAYQSVGDYYSASNPSGFITGVPSGTMNTSALEYNAVNEISGYNGSAIAQYGAEKQWLVHDDTLVHAANSAQYALGVNLSAVAQLLGGIDETVLFQNGTTATKSATLSEPITNFNRIGVLYGDDHYGHRYIEADTEYPFVKWISNYAFDGWNTATTIGLRELAWSASGNTIHAVQGWQKSTVLTATGGWYAGQSGTYGGIIKVVGIGRKQ